MTNASCEDVGLSRQKSELVWAGQAAQGGGIKRGGYKALHLGLVLTTEGREVARWSTFQTPVFGYSDAAPTQWQRTAPSSPCRGLLWARREPQVWQAHRNTCTARSCGQGRSSPRAWGSG